MISEDLSFIVIHKKYRNNRVELFETIDIGCKTGFFCFFTSVFCCPGIFRYIFLSSSLSDENSFARWNIFLVCQRLKTCSYWWDLTHNTYVILHPIIIVMEHNISKSGQSKLWSNVEPKLWGEFHQANLFPKSLVFYFRMHRLEKQSIRGGKITRLINVVCYSI